MIARKLLSAAVAALRSRRSAGTAAAQQWPTRPVTLIVPFPPGGSVDPLARLIGAKLSESLKQQFVVENKPGAGGSIGTGAAAKAAPDGYTWLFVFDTHAVNPALIPNLPFDTAEGPRAGHAGRHGADGDRDRAGQALQELRRRGRRRRRRSRRA